MWTGSGERLRRAVMFVRSVEGRPSLTGRTLRRPQSTSGATLWRISISAVTNSGRWGVPTLFGDDDDPDPPILRPVELSSTPRGTLPHDVTRISGPTLERARQAVEVLRQSEDPELSLMGFVDAAVVRLIVGVETRYPALR
jgi:hypothetical protein